jgi:hypothetical protein
MLGHVSKTCKDKEGECWMKQTINVNGKRMNKLEEILKLLQKLNEDFYTEEERENNGYPICLLLKADGSGQLERAEYPEVVFSFNGLDMLECFLRSNRRNQFMMAQKENG